MIRLRPLNGLVAVIDLPEETLRAAYGETLSFDGPDPPSPGWFIARVVALPDPIPDGLQLGDKVLVQGQCQPEGAGWLPSEMFGMPPGRRVIQVPCRILPSPRGSEELVERRREMGQLAKTHPPEDFPQDHPHWRTPEGEAQLAQVGEHIWQVRQIVARRRRSGRDRLMQPVSDVAQPEGILAVLEDQAGLVFCGKPDRGGRPTRWIVRPEGQQRASLGGLEMIDAVFGLRAVRPRLNPDDGPYAYHCTEEEWWAGGEMSMTDEERWDVGPGEALY